MITLPSNTQIWIAAGVTDLRRGFMGLSALVQKYSFHVKCQFSVAGITASEIVRG
jgi:transposase